MKIIEQTTFKRSTTGERYVVRISLDESKLGKYVGAVLENKNGKSVRGPLVYELVHRLAPETETSKEARNLSDP